MNSTAQKGSRDTGNSAGIDPNREELLTLRRAAKLPAIRRDGMQPHVSTLYRWGTTGIRGVRLEIVVVGGSTCTTAEAVDRFIGRLTNPAGPADAPTPKQRQRQIADAEGVLLAAGI